MLIYRFNHWHSGWHTDAVQSPYFLLHTGLRLPNYTQASNIRASAARRGELGDSDQRILLEAERSGDAEWKDGFLLCPDNYPLSPGLLLPPPSLLTSHAAIEEPAHRCHPLVVLQVELDPSSCRLFVAYGPPDHDDKDGQHRLPVHIAA